MEAGSGRPGGAFGFSEEEESEAKNGGWVGGPKFPDFVKAFGDSKQKLVSAAPCVFGRGSHDPDRSHPDSVSRLPIT